MVMLGWQEGWWSCIIIIIIIIIKKDWQCKAGRGRLTPYQSEDPSRRREQLGQQKRIGPAFETRQSHTIEYGVNQIVPERY